MNRTEKSAVVEAFRKDWSVARGAVFVDYRGLTVEEFTDLRKRLRRSGVTLRVIKNTLAKRAISAEGLHETSAALLEGPTAVALSDRDSVAPMRVLFESQKEFGKLKLKAALMDGQLYAGNEIQAVATLPPREMLLARLVSGFCAPLAGVVSTLAGVIRNTLFTLDAVRRKRERDTGIAA